MEEEVLFPRLLKQTYAKLGPRGDVIGVWSQARWYCQRAMASFHTILTWMPFGCQTAADFHVVFQGMHQGVGPWILEAINSGRDRFDLPYPAAAARQPLTADDVQATCAWGVSLLFLEFGAAYRDVLPVHACPQEVFNSFPDDHSNADQVKTFTAELLKHFGPFPNWFQRVQLQGLPSLPSSHYIGVSFPRCFVVLWLGAWGGGVSLFCLENCCAAAGRHNGSTHGKEKNLDLISLSRPLISHSTNIGLRRRPKVDRAREEREAMDTKCI